MLQLLKVTELIKLSHGTPLHGGLSPGFTQLHLHWVQQLHLTKASEHPLQNSSQSSSGDSRNRRIPHSPWWLVPAVNHPRSEICATQN